MFYYSPEPYIEISELRGILNSPTMSSMAGSTIEGLDAVPLPSITPEQDQNTRDFSWIRRSASNSSRHQQQQQQQQQQPQRKQYRSLQIGNNSNNNGGGVQLESSPPEFSSQYQANANKVTHYHPFSSNDSLTYRLDECCQFSQSDCWHDTSASAPITRSARWDFSWPSTSQQ